MIHSKSEGNVLELIDQCTGADEEAVFVTIHKMSAAAYMVYHNVPTAVNTASLYSSEL